MDPVHLSRTGKVCKRFHQVYKLLEAQLIDNFGISEDYLKLIQNKIQIELYYGAQIQTGDRSNQIFIDMLEVDNKQLAEKNGKSDLMQTLILIEKHIGVKLNPKLVSVYEFYNYVNFVSNNIKK